MAFDALNIKNHLSWGVPNTKTFGTYEQIHSKDRTVQLEMLYGNIKFLMILSLLSVILSPFFFLSLVRMPHFSLSPSLSLSILASLIIGHNDLSTRRLAFAARQAARLSSNTNATRLCWCRLPSSLLCRCRCRSKQPASAEICPISLRSDSPYCLDCLWLILGIGFGLRNWIGG